MKQELTYANTENVLINAIISGLYSFKTKEDAQEVLAGLHEKFILSKHSPSDSKDSLILWIKDYEVVAKEKNYAGNFCGIAIELKDDKKWTLRANKIPTKIDHHPQRVYQKSQHPNWGFPILRGIKKKKKYTTVERAAKELQLLQEEFPKTAIPAPGKLYLMIYEKAPEGKKGGAVNKYVLEIKATAESDGFYIDYYLNEGQKKKTDKAAPEAGKESTDKTAQGKFTAMVELRRAKKKPKAAAPKPKP